MGNLTQEFKMLKLSSIIIGTTNPRKLFNETALNELSESIKEKGVLQPILVRPKGRKYELVCGERRFRASQLAKLKQIPSIINELDDTAVVEVQIIENLQRENVHPYYEALSINNLIEVCMIPFDDVCIKLGVSKKYVTHRLKLACLSDDVAKVYIADKITISLALKIAALPKETQTLLFQKQLANYQDDDFRFYNFEYEIKQLQGDLNTATFDLKDDTFQKLNSCFVCPFNSKNNSLFADENEKAICQKVSCFKSKIDMTKQRKIDDIKIKKTPIVISNHYYTGGEEMKETLKENSIHLISQKEIDLVEEPHLETWQEYKENSWVDETDEEELKKLKSDFQQEEKEYKEDLISYQKFLADEKTVKGLLLEL